jgi:hypothetical protein
MTPDAPLTRCPWPDVTAPVNVNVAAAALACPWPELADPGKTIAAPPVARCP